MQRPVEPHISTEQKGDTTRTAKAFGPRGTPSWFLVASRELEATRLRGLVFPGGLISRIGSGPPRERWAAARTARIGTNALINDLFNVTISPLAKRFCGPWANDKVIETASGPDVRKRSFKPAAAEQHMKNHSLAVTMASMAMKYVQLTDREQPNASQPASNAVPSRNLRQVPNGHQLPVEFELLYISATMIVYVKALRKFFRRNRGAATPASVARSKKSLARGRKKQTKGNRRDWWNEQRPNN